MPEHLRIEPVAQRGRKRDSPPCLPDEVRGSVEQQRAARHPAADGVDPRLVFKVRASKDLETALAGRGPEPS